MRFTSTLFALLSTAVVANGFTPARPASFARGGRYVDFPFGSATKIPYLSLIHQLSTFVYSHSMSTTEDSKTEGKKAGPDAPPVQLGWNSHSAVVSRVLFPIRWHSFELRPIVIETRNSTFSNDFPHDIFLFIFWYFCRMKFRTL
jgi:hypothetical protein